MLQPPWAGHPTVSIVLPARDEEATVGRIVAALAALEPSGTEIVVVDDGSTDHTPAVAAAAGARVVSTAGVLGGLGPGPGKGRALWTGLASSGGEVVVFCDADLEPFHPGWVAALVGALLDHSEAALVKGRYRRAGTGGRVTELVAGPALELLHPALAHLDQPLGGEYAGWRAALEQLPFVAGWGVDLGLVLDMAGRLGPGSVIQADLGVRSHRNRPLAELRPQARAVLEVALHRAGCLDRRPPECPPLASVAAAGRAAAGIAPLRPGAP